MSKVHTQNKRERDTKMACKTYGEIKIIKKQKFSAFGLVPMNTDESKNAQEIV